METSISTSTSMGSRCKSSTFSRPGADSCSLTTGFGLTGFSSQTSRHSHDGTTFGQFAPEDSDFQAYIAESLRDRTTHSDQIANRNTMLDNSVTSQRTVQLARIPVHDLLKENMQYRGFSTTYRSQILAVNAMQSTHPDAGSVRAILAPCNTGTTHAMLLSAKAIQPRGLKTGQLLRSRFTESL